MFKKKSNFSIKRYIQKTTDIKLVTLAELPFVKIIHTSNSDLNQAWQSSYIDIVDVEISQEGISEWDS